VRCTDKRLGAVAIKFASAAEPQRLEREAALMQRVAHPNICSLREHRLLEGGLFGMVLELMDGGSLQQQIAEAPDQRLPEAAVTEMSLQVLQGLYFMHEKGVIHRDVKPSNIMLCSAGPGGESAAAAAAVRYKLIDLSIAAMDGDVQGGAQVETVYFMIRTEAVAEITLRLCSFHARFLSRKLMTRGGAHRWRPCCRRGPLGWR
jgi:serine/threonine protein kinase